MAEHLPDSPHLCGQGLSPVLPSRTCFTKAELKTKAQTEEVVTVVRRVVAAIGNTAVPGVVVPTTPQFTRLERVLRE